MRKLLGIGLICVIGFSSCGKPTDVMNGNEIIQQDQKGNVYDLQETELVLAMQQENEENRQQPGENCETEDSLEYAIELMQYETMETTFFSLQIDKITVTDTVAEYTANEGMEFIVLDVVLQNRTENREELVQGKVPMYATDFCLYWGKDKENGTYPANTGILEELPKEYELEDIKDGKLIFLVPKNQEMLYLVYEEYVTYGDIRDSERMNTWMIKMLPVDWEREKTVQ